MTSSVEPSSNTTVSRHALSRNAEVPIIVTVLGIINGSLLTMAPVMAFSPNATLRNASFPIVCSPSFRVTFTSLVQPENAPLSMLTTVPGIVTLVILVLFLKTLLPIVFTSAGISTAPPVPLYLVSLPSVSIVKSDALNAAASSEASFSSSSSPSSSSSVSSDSISSSSAPSSPSGSDSPSDTSPSSGFISSPVPSFSPGSVSSPSPVPSPGFFPSSSPVPSSDPVSPSFPVPSSDPVSPSSPVPSSDPVSPSSPVPSSDPVSPPVPVSSPDPVSPPVSVSSPDPVSLPVPLSSPDPEPASTPLSLSKVVSSLISVADITPPHVVSGISAVTWAPAAFSASVWYSDADTCIIVCGIIVNIIAAASRNERLLFTLRIQRFILLSSFISAFVIR